MSQLKAKQTKIDQVKNSLNGPWMAPRSTVEDLKESARDKQAQRQGQIYLREDEQSHLETILQEKDLAKKLEPDMGTYRSKDEVQRNRPPSAAFSKDGLKTKTKY